MRTQDKKNSTSRNRVKLALIPVLVVVLAVVCWPAGDANPNSRRPSARGVAAVTPTSATASGASEGAAERSAVWPAWEPEQVAALNPFHRSWAVQRLFGETSSENGSAPANSAHSFDSGAEGETREGAAGARQVIDFATVGTLQAVLHSERGWVALVDSHIVRPGETIGGRYRVTEISERGVLVEPLGTDLPPPPDSPR